MEITMDNIIFLVLVLIIIFNLFRIIQYLIKSIKFYKTPYFSKPLVGMYVKFSGIVQENKNIKLDIINGKCEFYELKKYTRKRIKKKAPKKGYKTVQKLVTQKNSGKFILSNNGQNIIVNIDKNNLSCLYQIKKIRNKDKTLKYKYLQKGDTITVYGRLIKKGKEYIITNTYNAKLQFIITLGDKLSFGSFFKKDILYSCLIVFFLLIYIFTTLKPLST